MTSKGVFANVQFRLAESASVSGYRSLEDLLAGHLSSRGSFGRAVELCSVGTYVRAFDASSLVVSQTAPPTGAHKGVSTMTVVGIVFACAAFVALAVVAWIFRAQIKNGSERCWFECVRGRRSERGDRESVEETSSSYAQLNDRLL